MKREFQSRLNLIPLLNIKFKNDVHRFQENKDHQFSIGSTAGGSTADALLHHLGIPAPHTHWINIFGSVYKLELPKQDISTIQQWEEHKKSAIVRSLLALILEDMKFKVSEMHVKLNRANGSQRSQIIEPLMTTKLTQKTETKLDCDNCDAKREETIELPPKHASEVDDKSTETRNSEDKSKISMVF